MAIIGAPTEWGDLIESIVPNILNLVIASWEGLTPPDADETEDNITNKLCRALQQNRTARQLMFQIRPQVVELDPTPGEGVGRMDIAFIFLVPSEDIYFCLECKRLNVVKDGKLRTYASEYVNSGMSRFITGQYAKGVQHGGMLAYVLNGDVQKAISDVEVNIQSKYKALCMTAPGTFVISAALATDIRAKETHHMRAHDIQLFRIHHLFMPNSVK